MPAPLATAPDPVPDETASAVPLCIRTTPLVDTLMSGGPGFGLGPGFGMADATPEVANAAPIPRAIASAPTCPVRDERARVDDEIAFMAGAFVGRDGQRAAHSIVCGDMPTQRMGRITHFVGVALGRPRDVR